MSRSGGRSGAVTLLLVLVVALCSFVAGMVAFNFIMAYSVGHGGEITVPELTGLPLAEAQRLGRELDLPVQEEGQRFSASMPPGFVLEQRPPAARRVKAGRRVSVIVSGGMETVEVPRVVGRSLRQAIVLLDAARLEVGDVAECPSVEVETEGVVAVSPVVGSTLQAGERVDLLVSQGAPPQRLMMPNLVGIEEDGVRRSLEAMGLDVLVSREYEPGVRRGPWEVVSHRPAVGHMVTQGDTVRLIAGVR